MLPDMIKLWTECLIILEGEVTPVGFNTWIKDIKPVSIDNNTIRLSVENSIKKNMIEMRYAELIKNTVIQVTGKTFSVEVTVGEEYPVFTQKKPDFNKTYQKYTFDNFVVGNSNRFAQSAALAVAEAPAFAYNPLFLYGGVGLGKTHLMHAIANYIKDNDPSSKIAFLSAETFTNELINSIKDNKNQEFRDKYRNIDVLLVDDIQFIIGKDSTQEEFFHTFNTLHNAGKQIILSSDKPPKEMETLDERFRSRFEWGLMADIQPPDYETRMAILKKNVELYDRNIDDEILNYIATNVKSNIRELEGALKKVIAASRLNNIELSMNLAEETLKDIISPDTPMEITPSFIVKVVAEHFGVSQEDIISKKRNSEYVIPRQICMYMIREHTTTSLDNIAKMLNKKDHTTILHGCKKIENEMLKNPDIKNKIDIIKKKMNI